MVRHSLSDSFVLKVMTSIHCNVGRTSHVAAHTRSQELCACLNTLRTGDADLRFYITTVQDG